MSVGLRAVDEGTQSSGSGTTTSSAKLAGHVQPGADAATNRNADTKACVDR